MIGKITTLQPIAASVKSPWWLNPFWTPYLFSTRPTRGSTANGHTQKNGISKTHLSGTNFNANHSTKWISGSKTIKIHTTSNHHTQEKATRGGEREK